MKEVKENVETNDPATEESERISPKIQDGQGSRSVPTRSSTVTPRALPGVLHSGAPDSRKVSVKEPTGGHEIGLPRGNRTGARGDPKKVTTSSGRTRGYKPGWKKTVYHY